ncbi:MAG: MHS family MFS transporter [Xanthobacteraceae bacterium]|nr:MHS family MFS transporter [Xanthobacteraceae bacterium]
MVMQYARVGESVDRRSMLRKARLSSFIGTVIEWYDFFIYGAAAALVFGKLFFPQATPLIGTMAAFGSFAVGFIARPLGGMIFGHFGDRIGRRTVLIVTLTIMGLSTFLIGLLPTYAQIGVAAPLMLTVLRVAQGLALGGEWGGAVLMVVEHSPADRRGWNSAWPQLGVPVGLVLSTGVMAMLTSLTADQFYEWGWRIPFLISIVLVAVGMLIRMAIDETPIFTDLEEKGEINKFPIGEVFRNNKKMVLLTIGARFAENGSFFIFTVFSLTYATKYIHVSENAILGAVVIAAIATVFTIPFFASLTDRIGRKPVFLAGAIFTGLFAFPFFWLIQTGQPALIALAIIIALAVGWSAMYAPQAAYFAEFFPPQVRYSGMSIGAQLVAIVAGGPSPLIATAAVAYAQGSPWLIALWLIGCSVISTVALLCSPETRGRDLGLRN